MFFSRLLREKLAGTPYAQHFLAAPGQLAPVTMAPARGLYQLSVEY